MGQVSAVENVLDRKHELRRKNRSPLLIKTAPVDPTTRQSRFRSEPSNKHLIYITRFLSAWMTQEKQDKCNNCAIYNPWRSYRLDRCLKRVFPMTANVNNDIGRPATGCCIWGWRLTTYPASHSETSRRKQAGTDSQLFINTAENMCHLASSDIDAVG